MDCAKILKSYEQEIVKQLGIERLIPEDNAFKTKDGSVVTPKPIPRGLMGVAYSPAVTVDSDYGDYSDGLTDVRQAIKKFGANAFDIQLKEGFHRSYTFMIQLYHI